jgi:hypothetical protein
MPNPDQIAEQLAAQSAAALPKWKCHKEVWAAKITDQMPAGIGSAGLGAWTLDNGGYVTVSEALRARVPSGTSPVGGYYVRYADGFESWSPAKAFEEGYTRL